MSVGTERCYLFRPLPHVSEFQLLNAGQEVVRIGRCEVTAHTACGLPSGRSWSIAVGPKDRLFLISAKEGHNAAFVAVTQEG
jgi:hypothetical protein